MKSTIDLFILIATRSSRLPEGLRRRVREWLLQQQRADGGFPGRMGESDLYYTAFAARLCAALCAEELAHWKAMTAFLLRHLDSVGSLVDLTSAVTIYGLVRTLVDPHLVEDLEQPLRLEAQRLLGSLLRADGGYAKSPQSAFGTPYATFLAQQVCFFLDLPGPTAESVIPFLLTRYRPDGGFAELPQLRESGTNPTAAAVSLLADLGGLDKIDRQVTAQYLLSMQRHDGGFAAGRLAPTSDLLSTCSAVTALRMLRDSLPEGCNATKIANYVLRLEDPRGGFRGSPADDAPDLEYTFYALATLALVQT